MAVKIVILSAGFTSLRSLIQGLLILRFVSTIIYIIPMKNNDFDNNVAFMKLYY
jgi:hypothetical protein